MARNFAERFNHRYGEVFPLPYGFNYGGELVKILGLDGEGKMSKSENQLSTLYLADDDETIRKKIARAKTDQGPAEENADKPPYIENLFTLLKLVSSKETVEKFESDYNNSKQGDCIIRYGDMKKQLAEDMVAFVTPISERIKELEADNDYIRKVVNMGKEKAKASAQQTINEVREIIGFKKF
jgi:tryptophanyl-tRNA synthetase